MEELKSARTESVDTLHVINESLSVGGSIYYVFITSLNHFISAETFRYRSTILNS